jgi:hypothetical protein
VRAKINNGVFSATVRRDRGGNTIDVLATAAGAKPANVSVTVTRGGSRQEIAASVRRKAKARTERTAKRCAARQARVAAWQAKEAADAAKRASDNYLAAVRDNFMTTSTVDGARSSCVCVRERSRPASS